MRLAHMRESHAHTFCHIRLGIAPFPVAFLGSRRAQVSLARLRLGHSNLAESLSRFDPMISPFCRCGVVESVSHFLLFCPLHSVARARMFSTVLDSVGLASLPCDSQLLSLLLGTFPSVLPRASSLSIVRAVFEFVLSTKRVL